MSTPNFQTCSECKNDLVCHDQGECLSPTPDYGEPWHLTDSDVAHAINRHDDAAMFRVSDMARAVACVNACAGMDDPAKEIGAMRDAIQEAWTEIQYAEAAFAGMALRLHPSDQDNDAVLARTGQALAKLQPYTTK